MNYITHKYRIIIILCMTLLSSCNKLLDEKSDLRLSTPESVQDFQALLDRVTDVNINYAGSGEVCSDNYYLTDAGYAGLKNEEDKSLYIWQPDHVALSGTSGNDWRYCYKTIYSANSVIYGIGEKSLAGADDVKGQALAIRASRYLDAMIVWAPVYNKATADRDLGVPLRLDPDMNPASKRASVKACFDQIIQDLNEAKELLPVKPISVTRASKGFANGLLARTYLYMGDYKLALANALEGLKYNNLLIDYNTLNANDKVPIKDMNVEFVFWGTMRLAPPIGVSIAFIPETLYNLYEENDLRKEMLFNKNANGTISFRGDYTGSSNSKIMGITTAELYLIAAEGYARTGQLLEAEKMVGKLQSNRWKKGKYSPVKGLGQEELIALILQERRKELLFRGLRWGDLKRLNRDGANITLIRSVAGTNYTLPPNDKRYAIAIPEDIIDMSGIEQNER